MSDENNSAITTCNLLYQDQDTTLTGVLHWHAESGPRPGILLIHGGGGLDEHAREQARRYAELGYTVLATDMYGEGVAGNRERVMTTLNGFRDNPAALARRGQAGLTALANCTEVAGGLAAVGFCFGGMAALTLARSGPELAGADLVAAVSMHGSLATGKPAERGAVTAQLLVCHGALDPHVPMSDVVAFTEEMTAADADWQLIVYGGAMHGFTHTNAEPGAIPGVAYHAAADERSFAAARTFLANSLGGS